MAMARDGLLPPLFSAVDPTTQVPTLSTILSGICAAILALFMDVSELAGMVICYLPCNTVALLSGELLQVVIIS
jgi:amino acid transporter